MTAWMRFEMTEAEERGQYDQLQEAFYAVFVAAGAPKGAAMFASNPTHRGGYFYFTPEAAKLFSSVLQSRGARPCAIPLKSSVAYLVGNGDPNVWFGSDQ